jgi:hypothetical protein
VEVAGLFAVRTSRRVGAEPSWRYGAVSPHAEKRRRVDARRGCPERVPELGFSVPTSCSIPRELSVKSGPA